MLALVIYEGEHLGTATAMVLPPGDLAVTTTPIPAGASVEGRDLGQPAMPLRVVGTDRQLGVTVLRLPRDRADHADRTARPRGRRRTARRPTLTALAAVRGRTTPAAVRVRARRT